MSRDLESLHVKKLEHRLYRGGLPPFLLAEQPTESDFQDWMDSYWAKDIEELFRLDKRRSFLTFVELLLTSSGGIFEATRFARPTEVSRITILYWFDVARHRSRLNVSGAPMISTRNRSKLLPAVIL